MTQDELNALRDVTPSFGHVERIIDGRKVLVPQLAGEPGALFQREDDGVFKDATGTRWLTGWVRGERVKRRLA